MQKKGLSEACAGRQAKSEELHMRCTGCHAALLDPAVLGLVPGRPQSIRPCLLSGDGGGRGWEGCLRAVALGAAEQHNVGLWLVDRIVDLCPEGQALRVSGVTGSPAPPTITSGLAVVNLMSLTPMARPCFALRDTHTTALTVLTLLSTSFRSPCSPILEIAGRLGPSIPSRSAASPLAAVQRCLRARPRACVYRVRGEGTIGDTYPRIHQD